MNSTLRGASDAIARRSSSLAVVAILALLATLVAVGVAPGRAIQTPQPVVASQNPVDWTPHVLDGRVNAIAQVGNMIVLGGTFTQVRAAAAGSPTLTRNRIVAFNATTGAISTTFAPQLDGAVEALVAAPDGQSVYVGGRFATVNGVAQNRVARLSIATGARVAGFGSVGWGGVVLDLRLHPNGHLIVGGTFNSVAGQPRSSLASLNAATGTLTAFVSNTLVTTRNGTRRVLKMDLSPTGSRLVIIGNFTSVDGMSRPQLAVLDTSGAKATVANWQTAFYTGNCRADFDTYVRGLDIDPTGKYFVVATTGGYTGQDGPCDVATRWDLTATGSGQTPLWRQYTGGDTMQAVAVTGTAVYIGGHFRWWNNPFANNAQGPGAVPRAGIVALDPRSGMPYTWNPGRARGEGVFDILATRAGVWFGNDTNVFAGEAHGRIAFTPLVGGTLPPPDKTGLLPTQLVQIGTKLGTDNARTLRYDGSSSPTAVTQLAAAESWANARGAMQIDNVLYTGWSNGTFTKRTFNGTSFGPPSTVNLYGGSFADDIPTITGMVYSRLDGRLYYTKLGSSQLHWRWFSPQSGIVGAARFNTLGNVPAMVPTRVRGMFLSGNSLYFADATYGWLLRMNLSKGVLTGPPQVVHRTFDWRARGIAIRGNDGNQPNPYLQ